jgi:hypothetical protein
LNINILKMTRITLDIIENKLDFFMELIENLEFVKVSSEYKVPMEQQDIVMERLDDITKNPKNLLAWDDVKEDI